MFYECVKESTESRELRSISKTWNFASGFCSRRLSFTFMPLSSVLDGVAVFPSFKDC